MKSNIVKMVTSTLMAAVFVASVPAPIFAMDNKNGEETSVVAEQNADDTEISPYTVSITKSYKIGKVGDPETIVEGSKKLLYDGSKAPCKRNGETVSAGASVSYSNTYSGSLMAPLKAGIQAEIGYSFGTERTFQAYKTSAPLNVGEYVKAYYKKTYVMTPVTQNEYITTKGYETVNGVSRPVDRTELKTYVVKCKEAILPVIYLDYYDKNNKLITKSANSANEDKIFARETYEFKNGEYVLVDRIEF